MLRTIVGLIVLLFGILDLWKWGWHLLITTPELIVGIVLVAIGGGLVAGGRARLNP